MNNLSFRINNFLLLIILSLTLFSCTESNTEILNKYELVPQDSLITWLQESRFPKPKDVIYLDSLNDKLSQDSIYSITNFKDIKLSYYWNSEKEIKYIKLTDATESDKEFFAMMNEIENANFNGSNDAINIVKVDCKEKGEILDKVYEADVANRQDGFQGISKVVDQNNLELVYSLYEKCGTNLFDELNDKQLLSIWLVIQHASLHFRKEFYPIFESLTKHNKFDKTILVMMEDRMLMDQSLPQKYGTQIQNEKLYKVDNIDSVNVRRERIGLNPLEEYLEELNVKLE